MQDSGPVSGCKEMWVLQRGKNWQMEDEDFRSFVIVTRGVIVPQRWDVSPRRISFIVVCTLRQGKLPFYILQ